VAVDQAVQCCLEVVGRGAFHDGQALAGAVSADPTLRAVRVRAAVGRRNAGTLAEMKVLIAGKAARAVSAGRRGAGRGRAGVAAGTTVDRIGGRVDAGAVAVGAALRASGRLADGHGDQPDVDAKTRGIRRRGRDTIKKLSRTHESTIRRERYRPVANIRGDI